MTRTSDLKALRKLLGFVFLFVNTILSLLSFLAVYGVVNFLSNANNYKFRQATTIQSNILNVTTAQRYLYVGNFTFNNTSLFAFDNFTVSFQLDLHNITYPYTYPIMNYTGKFGSVPAGQERTFPLNLTTISSPEINSTLTVSDDVIHGKIIPTNMTVSNSSYLEFIGAYVFDFFNFDLKIDLSKIITHYW